MADSHQGPCGTATRLPVPADTPRFGQTVCHWLLTAPVYHPLWTQYLLACVRLDDNAAGFPPPRLQFVGATHELLVLALNPERGVQDETTMAGYAEAGGGLPFLTPINIAEQFQATDDEMVQVCNLACLAVVNCRLNPETDHTSQHGQEGWLAAVTKTLAHIRGEEHAS